MAKKKEKTLEEKLQEALVPENQWPYMLPENWCWVKLNKLYHVNPKNIVEDDSVDAAFIPMANIEPNFIGKYKFEVDLWNKVRKGHTQFADGDVTFAKISPCFENGKVFIAENLPNGIGAGTTELIVLRNRKIAPKYTFYLISTEKFVNGGRRTYSGVVGQQRISMDYVNQFPIPLPPLPEQKRIVNRIESLFAKLDEAKEKIQQVLDGAEMRKAAILHKAFTGELTKNWRKENTAIFENSSLGIDEELISDNLKELPDNWCWCKIGDFLELKAGKNIKAENISIEKNDNNKYACYGGNGIRGYVDSFNVEGTHIIIGRQGALCGNINIAENKFYATEHAVVVYPRYDTDISWLSENLRFLNLNQYSRSAAQPGLAVKNINNVLMPVAPYAEQVEMGRLISQMLNVWKQKEIICNKVLNKIDTMKKSILAKAFRGELGTNNPTEDSALNLLKEVLQDKS